MLNVKKDLLQLLPSSWRWKLKYWHYRKRQCIKYYGTPVHFARNSVLFYRVCREGVYERATVNLITSLVEPGSCYFDVGGNIGLMAAPILHNCPNCRVVSFEPSPNSLPYLRRTREASPHRQRWHVIGKACGVEEGELEFQVATPDQGAFDGFRNTGRVEIDRTIRVPVTTLDAEWERLEFPRVSVIKVDVEGAELQVLSGARRLLLEERPALVIEWTDLNLVSYGIKPSALLRFAREAGYELYSSKPILPITNRRMLKLEMKTNDMFLLLPLDEAPMAERRSSSRLVRKVVEI